MTQNQDHDSARSKTEDLRSKTEDPRSKTEDQHLLRFPHHALDVYRVALEALVLADGVAKDLPRGYGALADQLRRASQSAFLQVAEGAARTGADRAARLRCARAEACEAAACTEALLALGLVSEARGKRLLRELARVAAMLTRLAPAQRAARR